jgi:hypothetical protein
VLISTSNRVFEQAGVLYGPRLEPISEAGKEAALKHKTTVGFGPTGKCERYPPERQCLRRCPQH